jgi:hypothetical protein
MSDVGGVVGHSGNWTPAASGGGAPASGAPASNAALQQTLSLFPSYAWMLNIPELQGIILAAVSNKTPVAALQSQLETTQWWQQHGQSARQWQQLVNTDNATARGMIDSTSSKITNLAMTMGVSLDGAHINALANQALEFNWNDDQLKQAVVANYHYASNSLGQAGLIQNQLRRMAQDYMLPVSDQTLQKWVTDVVSGRNVVDNFQQELVAQARSRYASNPQILNALDKGATMKEIVTPFKEQAASLLDMAPEAIDFTDPKWSKLIDHVLPDGTHTLPNIEDFRSSLMLDPQFGFDRTVTGRSIGTTLTTQLAKRFGTIG